MPQPLEQQVLFELPPEDIHDGAWRKDTNFPQTTEPYASILIQLMGSGNVRYEIGCIYEGQLCVHTEWADGSNGLAVVQHRAMRWILLEDVHKILKEAPSESDG